MTDNEIDEENPDSGGNAPDGKGLAKHAKGLANKSKEAIEFFGKHPFVTGLLALLGIAGLILSFVGYQRDRSDALDTTKQVLRVERKIDEISEKNRSIGPAKDPVYRECDDHQVYLAVMESARNLPEPYSKWEVRGSTGKAKTISSGVCEMTVLFVTGDPTGKMTEVDVSYKTDVPVSSIRIQTTKSEENECENIVLSDDLITTSISGEVKPEGYNCYYLNTHIKRTVKINVNSKIGNTAASVSGVGDARDEFEFLTTKNIYEIRVFQLMRSVTNDRYALVLSVK